MKFILGNYTTKRAKKKRYFGAKSLLPIKKLINSCDVTWGTQDMNNMATRRESSSSSSVSEDDSATEHSGFFESDGEMLPMNEEGAGPRPYRFEPQRLQNDEEDGNDDEASGETTDSKTDRMGNTDWLVFLLSRSIVKFALRIKVRGKYNSVSPFC